MRSTSSTDVIEGGLHKRECMALFLLESSRCRPQTPARCNNLACTGKSDLIGRAIPLLELFPRAADERGLFYPRLRSPVACVRR